MHGEESRALNKSRPEETRTAEKTRARKRKPTGARDGTATDGGKSDGLFLGCPFSKLNMCVTIHNPLFCFRIPDRNLPFRPFIRRVHCTRTLHRYISYECAFSQKFFFFFFPRPRSRSPIFTPPIYNLRDFERTYLDPRT